ncbi:MAG: cytochrome-c peroxidase, partial [Planctomycetota bacterium]
MRLQVLCSSLVIVALVGSTVAAQDATPVMLGDPELTAGIPGEGPLGLDELTNWLDDPRNHDELTIALPMGIAGAKANITGIDENPMTRAKIELGRQLYFDTRLSADNTVSCASCHHPDTGYTAATQFGVGIQSQTGNRNSPVSYNRILSGPQFWDGRADSLEAQAIGPIENPIEMGNTHDACVATLKAVPGYLMQFEKVFPDEDLNIDTVGKAIATFERAVVTGPAPYDYL